MRLPTEAELKAQKEAEEAAAAAALAADPKGKKAPPKGKDAPPQTSPSPVEPQIGFYEQGRWVIPANGTVDLAVRFQSAGEEVAGRGQERRTA